MAAATTGTQTESATPAVLFCGNGTGTGVLDTALLAAGWVLVDVDTATQQGTVGSVYFWRNATSRFVVLIEPDPTNHVIRFRASETINHMAILQDEAGAPDAGNSFNFTYGGGSGATITIGTNATAAAIQADLRTLTGDAGLVVTGTTDAGPFNIAFTTGFAYTTGATRLAITNVVGMSTAFVSRGTAQPVHGGVGNTAYTPTANNSTTDTFHTINAVEASGGAQGHLIAGNNTMQGHVSVYISPGGGAYWLRVDPLVISLATRGVRVVSLGPNNWVQVGEFTSLFQASPDPHPLFLAGGASTNWGGLTATGSGAGPSWAANTATIPSNMRVSRSPGVGALSSTDAFSYVYDLPIPTGTQSTTSPTDATYGVLGYAGAPAGGQPPLGVSDALAAVCTVHGMASGAVTGRGSFRGYIPNTVIFLHPSTGADTTTVSGQSVYINGALYYCLGQSRADVTHGQLGGANAQFVAAIKAAA